MQMLLWNCFWKPSIGSQPSGIKSLNLRTILLSSSLVSTLKEWKHLRICRIHCMSLHMIVSYRNTDSRELLRINLFNSLKVPWNTLITRESRCSLDSWGSRMRIRIKILISTLNVLSKSMMLGGVCCNLSASQVKGSLLVM